MEAVKKLIVTPATLDLDSVKFSQALSIVYVHGMHSYVCEAKYALAEFLIKVNTSV